MGKLNIEAVTGMRPEQLGLHPNTDFCTDALGNVIGIITAGGFEYDYRTSDEMGIENPTSLPELITQVNEEQGGAE